MTPSYLPHYCDARVQVNTSLLLQHGGDLQAVLASLQGGEDVNAPRAAFTHTSSHAQSRVGSSSDQHDSGTQLNEWS